MQCSLAFHQNTTYKVCKVWRRYLFIVKLSITIMLGIYSGKLIFRDRKAFIGLFFYNFRCFYINFNVFLFFSFHPQLYLSSNISLADYNMGYCLTGTLDRGCQQTNQFQTTHFAVIRRCWPSLDENGTANVNRT
jgi:hypothetical protein